MKWFLSACVLAGVAAVLSSTSCGAKQNFCPTKPEYSCLDYDAGATGGMGGLGGDPCDGQAPMFCLDGVTRVCNLSQCPP
jgi:hypothetical protein